MNHVQSWIVLCLSAICVSVSLPSTSIGQVFSERLLGPPRDPVISRPGTILAAPNTPQLLPAPSVRQAQSIDNEPLSLSDSSIPSRFVQVNNEIEATTPLSLGQQVWSRLLELERENAELTASLDYERKLGTYQQRTDIEREKLVEEIAALRQQIEQNRAGQHSQLEDLEFDLKSLKSERDQLQSALESSKHALDALSKEMRVRTEQFEQERNQWNASRENQVKPTKKQPNRNDVEKDSSPTKNAEDAVSATRGGVQILVHQASWIEE